MSGAIPGASAASLGASALGLVWLVAVHAPPFVLVLSWSRAPGLALRLCQALVVWAALLLGAATSLAALGAFAPLPLAATVLGSCGVAWWLRRRRGPPEARLRLWPSAGADRLLLLAALGVLVVPLAHALCAPPTDWDSLAYHLVRAAHLVQHGDLREIALPGEMDNFNRFPWNGNVLLATLMVPFHDDTCAALLNFPFVALLGCALVALGAELGAAPADRRLVAGVVCSAPIILGSLPAGLVDVQIMGELAAGLLFVTRVLRGGGNADAAAAFAVLGVALGTKLTAVLPSAILLAMLVVGLGIRRELHARRVGALLGMVVLLVGLAAPRYVWNLLETGNPFFPLPIPFVGRFFPGARVGPYSADAAHGAARDLESLLGLFAWHGQGGMQLGIPGNGPQLLVALPLALWLALRGPRGMRVLAVGACLAWLVPMLLFYLDRTPSVVGLRRYWPSHSPRYLAGLLPFASAGALGAVAAWPALRLPVRALWAVLIVGNLTFLDLAFLRAGTELALAGAVLAVLVAWVWLAGMAVPRGTGRRLAAMALAACAAVLVCNAVRVQRADTRYEYWTWYHERHPAKLVAVMAGWKMLDDPAVARTVAIASWKMLFLYPAMGSRLQNRLVWARTDGIGRFDPSQARGEIPVQGDYAAWRANLKDLGVDAVLLQHPLVRVDGSGEASELPELKMVSTHLDEFRMEAFQEHVGPDGKSSGQLWFALVSARS